MRPNAEELSGNVRWNASARLAPGCRATVATGYGDDVSRPDRSPRQIDMDHFQAELVVVNKMGLHARPATRFVELANKFECDVTIYKGGEKVDGKSILQLLSLSAEMTTRLLLETRGRGAEAAILALGDLVSSGFDEGEVSPDGSV